MSNENQSLETRSDQKIAHLVLGHIARDLPDSTRLSATIKRFTDQEKKITLRYILDELKNPEVTIDKVSPSREKDHHFTNIVHMCEAAFHLTKSLPKKSPNARKLGQAILEQEHTLMTEKQDLQPPEDSLFHSAIYGSINKLDDFLKITL